MGRIHLRSTAHPRIDIYNIFIDGNVMMVSIIRLVSGLGFRIVHYYRFRMLRRFSGESIYLQTFF